MRFCQSMMFADPDQWVELAPVAEAAGFDQVSLSDHVFYPDKLDVDVPVHRRRASRCSRPRRRGPTCGSRWGRWRRSPSASGSPPTCTCCRSATRSWWPRRSAPRRGSPTTGCCSAWAPAGCARSSTSSSSPSSGGAPAWRSRSRCCAPCGGGGMVEHHGEFYDFDRLEMAPVAGPSRSRSSIGGHCDIALRRAARIGDGWMGVYYDTDGADRRSSRRLQGFRHEYGTADRPFEIQASIVDRAAHPRRLRRAGRRGCRPASSRRPG